MNLLMKYEKIEPVIHNVVNHNRKYQYLHNFAYVHFPFKVPFIAFIVGKVEEIIIYLFSYHLINFDEY